VKISLVVVLGLALLLPACPSYEDTPPAPDQGGDSAPADQGQPLDAAPGPDLAQQADQWVWPDAHTWPDLPDNRPYTDIEHLRDDALKSALYDLVKNHTALSYDGAREAIFTVAGGGVDVVGGQIECIYTGQKVQADGTTAPGGFNTEHSWPKSEGADTAPAQSDLNHLFPTDASANSYRGNLPYGNTGCAASGSCSWSVGGSMIGEVLGGSGKVFQVRPERRGDIARAHFYFAVRYQMAIPWLEETWLRAWNYADPPDTRERDRADAIQGLQSKRNPFVDRPDFVEYIADF
jgi:deoxyribonuclease-1